MLLESVVLWRRNIADKIWALQGYEKRLQNFRPITIHPIHGGNVAYLKTKKGAQFFGFCSIVVVQAKKTRRRAF